MSEGKCKIHIEIHICLCFQRSERLDQKSLKMVVNEGGTERGEDDVNVMLLNYLVILL